MPTLTYTPAKDFTGLDGFSFFANNGIQDSRPADVQIHVHPSSADTRPPEVLWTSPADGGTAVPVPSPVLTDALGLAFAPFPIIRFSEALSETTVASGTVQLQDDDGAQVPISLQFYGMTNQAVIARRESLPGEAWYTVTVTTGAKDLAGNPLGADYTWSFRAAWLHRVYLPVTLRD
jgi:hypothetical protein